MAGGCPPYAKLLCYSHFWMASAHARNHFSRAETRVCFASTYAVIAALQWVCDGNKAKLSNIWHVGSSHHHMLEKVGPSCEALSLWVVSKPSGRQRGLHVFKFQEKRNSKSNAAPYPWFDADWRCCIEMHFKIMWPKVPMYIQGTSHLLFTKYCNGRLDSRWTRTRVESLTTIILHWSSHSVKSVNMHRRSKDKRAKIVWT